MAEPASANQAGTLKTWFDSKSKTIEIEYKITSKEPLTTLISWTCFPPPSRFTYNFHSLKKSPIVENLVHIPSRLAPPFDQEVTMDCLPHEESLTFKPGDVIRETIEWGGAEKREVQLGRDLFEKKNIGGYELVVTSPFGESSNRLKLPAK